MDGELTDNHYLCVSDGWMGKRFVPCSVLCMYYHVALTSDRSVYDQHFGGWEILVSGGSWHLGYDCSSYLGMECQCREVC